MTCVQDDGDGVEVRMAEQTFAMSAPGDQFTRELCEISITNWNYYPSIFFTYKRRNLLTSQEIIKVGNHLQIYLRVPYPPCNNSRTAVSFKAAIYTMKKVCLEVLERTSIIENKGQPTVLQTWPLDNPRICDYSKMLRSFMVVIHALK